jgi:hypothetical protein
MLRKLPSSFVAIRKNMGRSFDETPFESGKVFPSENAALEAGIRMGKQQIDSRFQPKNILTSEDLVGLQD